MSVGLFFWEELGEGGIWGKLRVTLLASAAPRPWVGISAEWQREWSQISCLVCGLQPQLLGFPRLLERQPFGEAPVFPGGAGRAAQDTWIPLLPVSSSLCEEGIKEFLALVHFQSASVTSYPSIMVGKGRWSVWWEEGLVGKGQRR